MNLKRPLKAPNEDEIDEIVIAEADNDSTSEKPIRVRRPKVAVNNLDQDRIARLPITSDPEILSGETVFSGTRVPVTALLDNIEAGLTLDEFIDNFPPVTREQAIQVLESARKTSHR